MRYFLTFSLLPFLASSALAQSGRGLAASDIIPLRSCAKSLSFHVDDTKPILVGFASDDQDSIYFVDCTENYKLGRDHYIYTTSGVYYFFEKEHLGYRNGEAPTQFRLSLENETYYFVGAIDGGMNDLFDAKGNNLSISASQKTIDVSAKNPIINFYNKALTGRSDATAAVIAEPVSGERLIKAQECIQKEVKNLAKNLVHVFKIRRDRRQVSEVAIQEYEVRVRTALNTPACRKDLGIEMDLNQYLNTLDEPGER